MLLSRHDFPRPRPRTVAAGPARIPRRVAGVGIVVLALLTGACQAPLASTQPVSARDVAPSPAVPAIVHASRVPELTGPGPAARTTAPPRAIPGAGATAATPAPGAATPSRPAPAQVILRIPNAGKHVFLTVDDGNAPQESITTAACRDHVPMVMFIVGAAVRDHPSYFRGLQRCGVVVANHTQTHRTLRGLSLAAQTAEICGAQDTIERHLGIRPVYMRPPRARYDANTLVAARACGIEYVMLYHTSAWDGRISNPAPLSSGDMLLFHFFSDAAANMKILAAFTKANGFSYGDFRQFERALVAR